MKLLLGIDIGGTNTAFGLVDEDGTVFCESAISTEKYKKFDDYEAYVKALCEAMREAGQRRRKAGGRRAGAGADTKAETDGEHVLP